MPGMAHYWETLEETRQTDGFSLRDGLQLLVQAELDNRTQSRNSRLVKSAGSNYRSSKRAIQRFVNSTRSSTTRRWKNRVKTSRAQSFSTSQKPKSFLI